MVSTSDRSWYARILRIEPGIALGQWIVDRVASNWALLVTLAGTGGMTYLASISAFLDQYGPVGWGAVGLAAFVLIALAMYLFSIARKRFADANYLASFSERPTSINPLLLNFERLKIDLGDFYYPFPVSHKGKVFRDCEIFGPGSLALRDGSQLRRNSFYNCTMVLVDQNIAITACAYFEGTILESCKLFQVTLFMDRQMLEAFKKDCLRHNMPMPPIVGYKPEEEQREHVNPTNQASDSLQPQGTEQRTRR